MSKLTWPGDATTTFAGASQDQGSREAGLHSDGLVFKLLYPARKRGNTGHRNVEYFWTSKLCFYRGREFLPGHLLSQDSPRGFCTRAASRLVILFSWILSCCKSLLDVFNFFLSIYFKNVLYDFISIKNSYIVYVKLFLWPNGCFYSLILQKCGASFEQPEYHLRSQPEPLSSVCTKQRGRGNHSEWLQCPLPGSWRPQCQIISVSQTCLYVCTDACGFFFSWSGSGHTNCLLSHFGGSVPHGGKNGSIQGWAPEKPWSTRRLEPLWLSSRAFWDPSANWHGSIQLLTSIAGRKNQQGIKLTKAKIAHSEIY